MPALPRIQTSVLADLTRQLRFAPEDAARRHVERAEALVAIIDPAQPYPEDWLVATITGYRPDLPAPALITGAALLRDLSALVERLSLAARYQAADVAGWPGVAELSSRWSVSRRTLERYRRLGLLARVVRVTPAPGVRRGGHTIVAFAPPVVAWFEERHRAMLAEAGDAAKRVDPARRERLVRRARRYRARLGWTRARVARRLAQTQGGTARAVERLLARHDRRAETPIFGRRAPMTEPRARSVERWLARGASARAVGRRLGRSAASVRRIARQERLRRLSELELAAGVEITPGEIAAALERPSPAITLGLGRPVAGTLAELLREAEDAGWPDASDERERANAYRALRARAAAALAAMDRARPGARALDAIITDLRWADRLKVELVRSQQRLLLGTIEGRLGRALTEVPGPVAASALEAGFIALVDAVDQFVPARGGRLAGPANVALARALARWAAGPGGVWEAARRVTDGAGRASAMNDPGSVKLGDWSIDITPWHAVVEPDPRVRAGLEHLADADRHLLMRRFGWLIGAPCALDQLAAEAGVTRATIARRERRALAAALRAARTPGATP